LKKSFKIHDGCTIDLGEVVATLTEKYCDPKLDSECYLLRTMFKNNSTILTLGNYNSKNKADSELKRLLKRKKESGE
jgi:hypothetical protein